MVSVQRSCGAHVFGQILCVLCMYRGVVALACPESVSLLLQLRPRSFLCSVVESDQLLCRCGGTAKPKLSCLPFAGQQGNALPKLENYFAAHGMVCSMGRCWELDSRTSSHDVCTRGRDVAATAVTPRNDAAGRTKYSLFQSVRKRPKNNRRFCSVKKCPYNSCPAANGGIKYCGVALD